jgi:hypothetical protein
MSPARPSAKILPSFEPVRILLNITSALGRQLQNQVQPILSSVIRRPCWQAFCTGCSIVGKIDPCSAHLVAQCLMLLVFAHTRTVEHICNFREMSHALACWRKRVRSCDSGGSHILRVRPSVEAIHICCPSPSSVVPGVVKTSGVVEYVAQDGCCALVLVAEVCKALAACIQRYPC